MDKRELELLYGTIEDSSIAHQALIKIAAVQQSRAIWSVGIAAPGILWIFNEVGRFDAASGASFTLRAVFSITVLFYLSVVVLGTILNFRSTRQIAIVEARRVAARDAVTAFREKILFADDKAEAHAIEEAQKRVVSMSVLMDEYNDVTKKMDFLSYWQRFCLFAAYVGTGCVFFSVVWLSF